MKAQGKLNSVAPDLWTLSFPLRMLGVDLQRNVTVLRLPSEKLIIHSTAPFSHDDVASIQHLGEPGWIIDTLLRHDTFSEQGTKAFPGIPYLVPDGFVAEGVSTAPLLPPPVEWNGEVDVLLVGGAPSFGEVVMLHRPSRTLIVADLLFNFPGKHGIVMELFLKVGAVGGKHDPGVTRPFKRAIEDEAAFTESIHRILEWDFDRVIVGHGEMIRSGGKEKLRSALRHAGISGRS